MIRVLLVDDHASSRQPLAILLEREPDLTVIGQAGSLTEARRLLADVDLAVVDLGLPDGDGVELVTDVRAANPEAQILVLTADTDRAHWARAVEAGAAGVLEKSSSIVDVIDALRRLAAGELLFSPREAIELLRLAGHQRDRDQTGQAALTRLTPREREVLQALADGLGDKEIAERLYISPKTARAHVVNVLGKLDVDSRLQALVFAVRHGAVTIR